MKLHDNWLFRIIGALFLLGCAWALMALMVRHTFELYDLALASHDWTSLSWWLAGFLISLTIVRVIAATRRR